MQAKLENSEMRTGYARWHLARVAGMVLVAIAMPLAHINFGERYPGGGPGALGVLGTFIFYGLVASVIYLVFGTFAHFFVRRKWPGVLLATEVLTLITFVSALVLAGVVAHYA